MHLSVGIRLEGNLRIDESDKELDSRCGDGAGKSFARGEEENQEEKGVSSQGACSLHWLVVREGSMEGSIDSGVHLVDAYLAASASQTKIPVASFDTELDRFKDIERFEPPCEESENG